MATDNLTTAQDFCSYHQIDYTLITAFHDAGLLELTIVNQTTYIPQAQLSSAERLIRLYDELGINIEGLAAVTHLLQRMESLRQEVVVLRNRLSVYE